MISRIDLADTKLSKSLDEVVWEPSSRKATSLDRNVALKTIQSRWSNNPIFLARFIREAYAAAQLTHHNVIQIYDLGEIVAPTFSALEFVSGHSIAVEIQKKGPLDPLVAVNYAIQAARGFSSRMRKA